MFKILQRFCLLAALPGLAACSQVSVSTDFDHAAPFYMYRTYALVPANGEMTLPPLSETAFRDALRSNLAAHGLREATDNVDLYVMHYASKKEKVVVHQTTDFGQPYGYAYGYVRYGAWAGTTQNHTDVLEYTEGTLIMDFVDAKTHKLIFRGIGKGVLDDPKTNAQRTSQAVQKIILEFPVSNLN